MIWGFKFKCKMKPGIQCHRFGLLDYFVPRIGVEPISDALQAPAVTTLAISARDTSPYVL